MEITIENSSPPPPSLQQQEDERWTRNLGEQQREAFRMVVREGLSCFVSGGAGTGKTHVLKYMVGALNAQGKKVAITASCGVAAAQIDGTTLHRFAGIGYGKEPVEKLLKMINRGAKDRWKTTDVLFIDEISMISPVLFDKLDLIGRKIRKREDLPFGGLQVVCIGDFLQLPPVEKRADDMKRLEALARVQKADRTNKEISRNVAKDAVMMSTEETISDEMLNSYFKMVPPPKEQHQEDKKAISKLKQIESVILNEARDQKKKRKLEDAEGGDEDDGIALFAFEANCWSALIQRTILLDKVYRQNDEEFVAMLSRIRLGMITDEDTKRLRKRERVKVNIHGIEPTILYPMNRDVTTENRKRLAELPGDIHRWEAKCRVTFNNSARRTFYQTEEKVREQMLKAEYTEPVVELKRGAQVILTYNLDVSLKLVNGARGRVIGFQRTTKKNLNQQRQRFQEKLEINQLPAIRDMDAVEDPYAEFDDDDYVEEVPIVQFACGSNIPITRNQWVLKSADGSWHGTITQIPLKLAYALTIHKAQGMSLDCAQMDLGRNVFTEGQTYVALSRVRTLEGLSLSRFFPGSVRCNRRVLNYYERVKHLEEDRQHQQQQQPPPLPLMTTGEEEEPKKKNKKEKKSPYFEEPQKVLSFRSFYESLRAEGKS